MIEILPLSKKEYEAKPAWATHYYKVEHDYTLFESREFWQWFINGELIYKPQVNTGINNASVLIEG